MIFAYKPASPPDHHTPAASSDFATCVALDIPMPAIPARVSKAKDALHWPRSHVGPLLPQQIARIHAMARAGKPVILTIVAGADVMTAER